eukprot:13751279-Alexandrium_andersonii.AAC.1
MLDAGGNPRPPEEVKSKLVGFFGPLYSEDVLDSALPPFPLVWASLRHTLGSEDRAWRDLETW